MNKILLMFLSVYTFQVNASVGSDPIEINNPISRKKVKNVKREKKRIYAKSKSKVISIKAPNPHNKSEILDTADPLWAHKFTRTIDAWKLLLAKERYPDLYNSFIDYNDEQFLKVASKISDSEVINGPSIAGKDVTIGHIDTGILPHPMITDKNYRVYNETDGSYDVLKNQKSNKDVPSFFSRLNHGHGTRTLSVISSSPAYYQKEYGILKNVYNKKIKNVYGFAPGASILPIRAVKSVVAVTMTSRWDIAESIDRAVNKGADVINISIGGFSSIKLRKSIKRAKRKGIPIVAAAGNATPLVVWPAHNKDTIAPSSCNIKQRPWKFTAKGKQIDIATPGTEIWHARPAYIYKIGSRENLNYVFDSVQGQGTSFTAPLTSSVIALFISFYGKEYLIDKYTTSNNKLLLVEAIRCQLKRSSYKPKRWKTRKYGTGILDSYNLLTMPLPDLEEIPSCIRK